MCEKNLRKEERRTNQMNKKAIKVRIGLYPFTLKFFKQTNEDYDGITWYRKREIEIRDDLDDEATILLIRHEVTHALLSTQGRTYQKKFDVEELCEFIAYKLPEINQICEFIENSLEVKPNEN